MTDVDNIVALVGATTTPEKSQIEREIAAHANLKIVERPTPDTDKMFEVPESPNVKFDTDRWIMDDYIGLMELQEKTSPKETILGMRDFCLKVIVDWNYVDKDGVKIPVSLEGMGKIKPREWNEVSKQVMELAKNTFLS